MTVVTSKLQASAAIITPPGRPNTRKLDKTWGDIPLQMASHTEALVTGTVCPFAYSAVCMNQTKTRDKQCNTKGQDQ